jgi:hypothetical protein
LNFFKSKKIENSWSFSHGLGPSGGPPGVCSYATMGLTLSTGLEYHIVKKEKINFFINSKIGIGKALNIEYLYTDCVRENHTIGKLGVGIIMTYNL